MWLFTPIGFFSATIAVPGSKSYQDLPLPESATRDENRVPHVMVRARVYDDLNNLAFVVKDLFGYEPEVYALKHHDYPYRIVIPREHWAAVVGNLASGINYPNFKNAVTAKQGPERHDLYMRVWSDLYRAEDDLERMKDRRRKVRNGERQGSLEWATPGRRRSRGPEDDPRSDSDMAALYDGLEPGSSAWYSMLASTEPEPVDPPRQRRKPRKKKGRKSSK